MSINERFSRIVRHKLSEIRDRFDQLDEEAQQDPAEIERRRKAAVRAEARRELDDAMEEGIAATPKSGSVDVAPVPLRPTGQRRTPEEIARAGRPIATSGETNMPDPLLYHYRLLGVESGSDFAAVQAAYNNLAARCDSSRFPAGSAEAREAETIRQRLEVSYKTLRDALDATAHRFGLLEFDDRPATRAPGESNR